MKTPTWFSWALAGLAALTGVCWGAPRAQEPDLGTPAQREAGKVLYGKYCAQCHGENGDGQGYAAPYLQPPPRDFTAAQFKIRATPSGAVPTHEDLRRVIRRGMPYTTMIGWPDFTDKDVDNIIYHIKTYSPNFQNPDYYDPPIAIPDPPAYTADSAKLGGDLYTQMECNSCHGETGRTDGSAAPTLLDDAENPIRPADLTKRWTFRGGATRKDIYRTFSTGLNGTPMPSYADSLTEEERWHLVDYVYSLGSDDEPNYADRLFAVSTEDEIDMAEGEALFEQAQSAHFPLIGQIMEPGRAFHPAANGIEIKAVHNSREIAFLVTWHDMRADISGTNSPSPQPRAARGESEEGGLVDEGGASEDQESAAEDFFGEVSESEQEAPSADDFFGEVGALGQDADDFFGEVEAPEQEADDFFGIEEEEEPADAAVQESAFSDAVAIQFPSAPPEGIRLPYFIFGDLKNSVDIWFADLAQEQAQRFIGRGSQSVTENDAEDLTMRATYEDGEWRVMFKKTLRSEAGVSFEEGQWVPVAFSVWDGRSQEWGNHRALTSWFYLYLEPQQAPSPIFPMTRAALAALGIEIAIVAWVRRKYRIDPSNLESDE